MKWMACEIEFTERDARLQPRCLHIVQPIQMRRIRRQLFLGLLIVTANPAAFGQTASAKVTSGSEYCHAVQFPGGWHRTKGMKEALTDHFLFGWPYEFRRTSSSGQEYLVAAVDDQLSNPRDYSPNKFWMNLRTGRVRTAAQAEWDSGVLVRQSFRGRGPYWEPEPENGVRSGDAVLLRGKLFRKSGSQWPLSAEHARVSPDGNWIAVQSWEGKNYANGNIPLLGPHGGSGKFFVDLYGVSSGRRFASIDGEEHDTLEADEPLGLTFWLESHNFILKLGSHLERMLVCEVPDPAEPGKSEK
jgi:hypothetical protein